jgi:hypothetical protein
MDYLVKRRRSRRRRIRNALYSSVPLLLLVLLVALSAGVVRVLERDTLVLEEWSEAEVLEGGAPDGAAEAGSSDSAVREDAESGRLRMESVATDSRDPLPTSFLRDGETDPNAATRGKHEAVEKSDPQETLELLMESLPPDLYQELLSSSHARDLWPDADRSPEDVPADLSRDIGAE